MNSHYDTLPADADSPCHCCGRTHRKQRLIDSFWMGASCADQYRLFIRWPNRTDVAWVGWEKQYDKVARMVRNAAQREVVCCRTAGIPLADKFKV